MDTRDPPLKRHWIDGHDMRRPAWMELYLRLRAFLVALARGVDAQVYLELGTSTGETIAEVSEHVDVAIGVEINAQRAATAVTRAPKATIHRTSSQRFLESYSGEAPDMIFIDACHQEKEFREDVDGSLRILARGGVIVCHDVDPPSAHWIVDYSVGTAYRAVSALLAREDICMTILPFAQAGVALITRRADRRVLFWDSVVTC